MANAKDRLNQLQEYMNFYQSGGNGANPFGRGFGRPIQGDSNFSAAHGGVALDNRNPFEQNNSALDWANAQLDKQQKEQEMQDQNETFKGMYGGGGQSSFGAPPAYVQSQMQPQRENPFSARAMQLNNDPYSGSGGGQDISNSLAEMFRGNKRMRVGG